MPNLDSDSVGTGIAQSTYWLESRWYLSEHRRAFSFALQHTRIRHPNATKCNQEVVGQALLDHFSFLRQELLLLWLAERLLHIKAGKKKGEH